MEIAYPIVFVEHFLPRPLVFVSTVVCQSSDFPFDLSLRNLFPTQYPQRLCSLFFAAFGK